MNFNRAVISSRIKLSYILISLGDLFPALDVPRKRDFDFEATVRQSTLDLKLQPEDGFILKVRVKLLIYIYE